MEWPKWNGAHLGEETVKSAQSSVGAVASDGGVIEILEAIVLKKKLLYVSINIT